MSQLKLIESKSSLIEGQTEIVNYQKLNFIGDHRIPKKVLSALGFRLVGKTLGEGREGRVVVVKETTSGKSYALKILFPKKSGDEESQNVYGLRGDILVALFPEHRNLIQTHGVIMSERNKWEFVKTSELSKYSSWKVSGILTEYLPKFKNFSDIKTERLTNSESKLILRQIASAINVLHKSKFIHRDIKHNNFLVNDRLVIKLIDFGTSRSLANGRADTLCGTSEFIAPEVHMGTKYSYGVDVWSFGVLMFCMLFDNYPFQGENDFETMSKVVNYIQSVKSIEECAKDSISKDNEFIDDHTCWDLLNKMLSPEKTRITMPEVLTSDFFTKKSSQVRGGLKPSAHHVVQLGNDS